MKLHYFAGKSSNARVSNFGDELNPWLWHRLIPELLDQDENRRLVAIGTLLNHTLPKTPEKIIFGAGAGYGPVPSIDSTWKIYFVRGTLSAKSLNLDPELAITDPAILVRKLFSPSGKKTYRWSYVPHFSEEIHNGAGWRELCSSIGVHYIDPTAPLEQVLTEIAESEIVFAEAMHGAIVADALRTPWVAVKTKQDILAFKWNDWLSSVQLPYSPFVVKRAASLIGTKPFLRWCDYQSIRAQMLYMIRFAKPMLSPLSLCEQLEAQVTEQLEALKANFARGGK